MATPHLSSFRRLRCLLLSACLGLGLAVADGAAALAAANEPPIETLTPVEIEQPGYASKPLVEAGTITLPVTLQRAPVADAILPTGTAVPLPPEPALEIRDDLSQISSIDLTKPVDDLWQRLRNGFSMPNLDSPLVADRQAWYLNRPELLKTMLGRSRRYLFYIVGELEKRGMPTELALLPMVESSYNPMALSPARASGIWQFIPSTGKTYRLQQNWWLDERRDIIASTGAALDYLQALYEMHGDWHLALASYNWGENAVARSVAKNQARHLPTDYAHISMPAETRYYVPKLQALKNILARPDLFGIGIDPIPNQPYFDTVDKPANMDVSLAAKLAEMPLDEFLALNPSYNRRVIPADKGSPLVLPTDKVQTFLANLQTHEEKEKPLSNWRTYTLRKGEKLDRVAARFNLTLARLKQINGIGPRSRIGPGTRLLVPGPNAPIDSKLAALDAPPEAAAAAPAAKARRAGKSAGKHGRKAALVRGRPVAKHVAGVKKRAAARGTPVKKRRKH